MSRRFSIGFVAALALLVSAGPALGGSFHGTSGTGEKVFFGKVISNDGSQSGWATFRSSLRGSYVAPVARGYHLHTNVDRVWA